MVTMTKRGNSIGHWVFVILISAFILWMVLIHPLTLPADKMPFVFAYDSKTHTITDPHKQKVEYALATGGGIIGAMILVIPVIINDRKYSNTLSAIMKNSDNIMYEDAMGLLNKLTYHVWRPGNSKEVQADLQRLLKKYKGRDLVMEQYGFSAELIKEL